VGGSTLSWFYSRQISMFFLCGQEHGAQRKESPRLRRRKNLHPPDNRFPNIRRTCGGPQSHHRHYDDARYSELSPIGSTNFKKGQTEITATVTYAQEHGVQRKESQDPEIERINSRLAPSGKNPQDPEVERINSRPAPSGKNPRPYCLAILSGQFATKT
jgi:hypothetical protein